MSLRLLLGASLALAMLTPSAQAVITIDFESGFVDNQQIGVVNTADGNMVTFSVGAAPGSLLARIAEVGPPRTAFVPDDIPVNTFVTGDYVLTDEQTPGRLTGFHNYYIDFAKAVHFASLNLIDFRADSGSPGDRAVLTAYVDAARTIVAGTPAIFVIPNPAVQPLPDGNIVGLGVFNSAVPFRALSLEFFLNGSRVPGGNVDVGTAIDNIYFKSVPEPATWATWLGLTALGLCYRRWRRRR